MFLNDAEHRARTTSRSEHVHESQILASYFRPRYFFCLQPSYHTDRRIQTCLRVLEILVAEFTARLTTDSPCLDTVCDSAASYMVKYLCDFPILPVAVLSRIKPNDCAISIHQLLCTRYTFAHGQQTGRSRASCSDCPEWSHHKHSVHEWMSDSRKLPVQDRNDAWLGRM